MRGNREPLASRSPCPYQQALSTDLSKMSPQERQQDAEKVAEAYRAMVAQAKAEMCD